MKDYIKDVMQHRSVRGLAIISTAILLFISYMISIEYGAFKYVIYISYFIACLLPLVLINEEVLLRIHIMPTLTCILFFILVMQVSRLFGIWDLFVKCTGICIVYCLQSFMFLWNVKSVLEKKYLSNIGVQECNLDKRVEYVKFFRNNVRILDASSLVLWLPFMIVLIESQEISLALLFMSGFFGYVTIRNAIVCVCKQTILCKA